MVDHLKDGAEAQIALELPEARLAEAQKAATEFLARTALQEQTLREFATRFEAIRHSTDAAVQSVTSQAAVIEVQRVRADEALKLIDEATRKAHSESGFAFNAKGNAEEHAKAIAKIRGEVEVDIAGLHHALLRRSRPWASGEEFAPERKKAPSNGARGRGTEG